MKLLNSKRVILTSATALAFVLALSLSVPATVSAGDGDNGEQIGTSTNVFEGPFDGLDLKSRSIWINDIAYLLDAKVKVKGTHKKLGLITDLKQGERIRATFRENPSMPSVPYITLIERL